MVRIVVSIMQRNAHDKTRTTSVQDGNSFEKEIASPVITSALLPATYMIEVVGRAGEQVEHLGRKWCYEL